MSAIVGIDLGTCNSCVAVIERGDAVVIPNRDGGRTTPSVVAFTNKGTPVGELARRQAVTQPQSTVYGVKRLLGRKATDPAVRDMARALPYRVTASPTNGDAWIQVREEHRSPEEISAYILEEMRGAAEDYLGQRVTDAVITVPAYFNDRQRHSTRHAGTIAGLNVRKILNEPTAAALGYGVHRSKKDQTLAVFDLGGGTFDVTIMQFHAGVFQVLATHGDSSLGGEDFDRRLIEHISKGFVAKHGVDITTDPVALQRLKQASEAAKRDLSSMSSVQINLPFLGAGPSGPLHLENATVSRELFDELTRDLVQRLEGPCRAALSDATLTPGQVDQVLLVGGMTRVPAVQRKAEEVFGKKPAKTANPDEIVAVGAATHTAIMTGEIQCTLRDVTPHSLGLRTTGDKMAVVIPRNTTVPVTRKQVFVTSRENQESLSLEVFQGENDHVAKNWPVGRFTVGGLPKGPAGQVRVEVSLTLNDDGVLGVKARDLAGATLGATTIAPAGGLSSTEVETLAARHRGPSAA